MTKFSLLFPLLVLLTPAFSQSWVQKASLPDAVAPRNHPVTFTIDGIGYLGTGYTINENKDQKDFYKYDPVADQWTQLNDYPGVARSFSYGIAYEGKGYMAFGVTDTGLLRDMWVFDPVANSWTEKTSCPCQARSHPAFVETNGKIYVGLGGGLIGNLNDFWEYTIATDTWKQCTDFPSNRRHHPFYFSIGDYVYVGFGHGSVPVDGFVVYRDFYRYDPATDSWTKLNDFPGEARVAGTQFDYNGKGYVLHGEGATHQTFNVGEFWEYNPADDSWVELPEMPGGGRWAPGTFVIGNTVYSSCGSDVSYADTKDLWAYTFTTSAVEPDPNQVVLSAQVYPNPASARIYVKEQDASSFQVTSACGALQMEGQYPADGIDISQLPAGIFYLKLLNGDRSSAVKFVKN